MKNEEKKKVALIDASNVVGYAGNALDDEMGSALVMPQFVGCGLNGQIKFKDLTPVSNPATYVIPANKIDIQYVDNGGYTIKEKVYRWDGSKWINNKTKEDASEDLITAGAGFSVGCAVRSRDALVSLRSAGEVPKCRSNPEIVSSWVGRVGMI